MQTDLVVRISRVLKSVHSIKNGLEQAAANAQAQYPPVKVDVVMRDGGIVKVVADQPPRHSITSLYAAVCQQVQHAHPGCITAQQTGDNAVFTSRDVGMKFHVDKDGDKKLHAHEYILSWGTLIASCTLCAHMHMLRRRGSSNGRGNCGSMSKYLQVPCMTLLQVARILISRKRHLSLHLSLRQPAQAHARVMCISSSACCRQVCTHRGLQWDDGHGSGAVDMRLQKQCRHLLSAMQMRNVLWLPLCP